MGGGVKYMMAPFLGFGGAWPGCTLDPPKCGYGKTVVCPNTAQIE